MKRREQQLSSRTSTSKKIKDVYEKKDVKKDELSIVTTLKSIDSYNRYVPNVYENQERLLMERMDGTVIQLLMPAFIPERDYISMEHKMYLKGQKNTCKLLKIIFKKCLNCIQFLHDNDIQHNDLNMNNFLFKFSSGRSSSLPRISVKIIDFETSRYDMLEDYDKEKDITGFIFSFKSMCDTIKSVISIDKDAEKNIDRFLDSIKQN